jgi:hypothetical protein
VSHSFRSHRPRSRRPRWSARCCGAGT